MKKVIDITGKKFGKLTVAKFHGRINQRSYWECVCECGGICLAMGSKLKDGLKTHCGCVKRIAHNKSHGRSRTKMHNVWWGMIDRCINEKNESYYNYGERGISVCERWMGNTGFVNFLEDMGERPSDKHSIERKNTNGNYEPSNCYWATRKIQNRNKRNTVYAIYNGISKPVVEWCELLKIQYSWVRKKKYRSKISSQEAFDFYAPKSTFINHSFGYIN